TAPRNGNEKKLSRIWAGILGDQTEEISIDDNFFDIGGHSLRATIMASKIHKEFNVKLPLPEIFKTPTIKELAKTIKGMAREKYTSMEPVEKKDYYSLSSAQKRMYFLQQMDLNSTAYNMPLILTIPVTPVGGKPVTPGGVMRFKPGTVILERLQEAFRKLIRRHESLRTSFELPGEAPIQRIHDTVEFDVDYYEISSQSGSESESFADTRHGLNRANTQDTVEKIVKDFLKPFDLNHAPLIRSGLIKQADGNFILLVDLHHIISDGTSQTILRDDFFLLYNNKELKPLKLQYKDFSIWQNNASQTGEIKDQENYWMEIYHGEIPRLNLLADYKRPEIFSFAGANYQDCLEAEETAGLRALAVDSGSTLYMNILAALNTLFYRYTGQTDIIIGSGIAGRPHADLQRIVGMFINTLAMRNYPQGDKNYRSFLKGVINGSIEAFQNQDVQFEELVDKLELPRDPSRNPLFDISMVVQNFRGPGEPGSPLVEDETAETGNLTDNMEPVRDEPVRDGLSSLELVNTTSKFDITFFITETVDNIHINIEYYTGIFKPATIQRLAAHLKNSVKAVINNP
ncbi:MAG: hypothetical protein GY757_12910, partial [bacterium]|nr:hypothetical protein [bacterium]